MITIKFRAWDELNQEMVYEKTGIFSGGKSSWEILKLYENVMQFTGLHDQNGKEIYINDIINVCVFFVSPENTDEDIHFRGIIIENELKVCLKIYSFLNDSNGWKKLSKTNNGFPFDVDYIEDDSTFIIPIFDLCAISGNLGEILEDNLEVIGNINENKYLLK